MPGIQFRTNPLHGTPDVRWYNVDVSQTLRGGDVVKYTAANPATPAPALAGLASSTPATILGVAAGSAMTDSNGNSIQATPTNVNADAGATYSMPNYGASAERDPGSPYNGTTYSLLVPVIMANANNQFWARTYGNGGASANAVTKAYIDTFCQLVLVSGVWYIDIKNAQTSQSGNYICLITDVDDGDPLYNTITGSSKIGATVAFNVVSAGRAVSG